jgi:thymidylate synthase ThyX
MGVIVEQIVGWNKVVNSARTTVGKDPIKKDPSDAFKKKILTSEHSPIRKLLFDITWENIPYWVAMHIRTHHVGFKSADDDLYFIETQRSDRTQTDRDDLPQTAEVVLNIQINAQAMINVSRVRLCRQASTETRAAWIEMLNEIQKIEPILYSLCTPNCVYRNGLCQETTNCCGYNKTPAFKVALGDYVGLF